MDAQRTDQANTNPLKVLYIDDHEHLADDICIYLKAKGFEAIPCSLSRDSFDLAKNSRPDVVVTDIKMPEFDGFQVIDGVHEACPEAKIIVVSAYKDARHEALRHPIDGFYEKPISPLELVGAINKAVLSP